jgi:hypothetical protein
MELFKKLSTRKEFYSAMILLFIVQAILIYKIISLSNERDELMRNFFTMMKTNKYSFNDTAILMTQISSKYEIDINYYATMLIVLTTICIFSFYLIRNNYTNENKNKN